TLTSCSDVIIHGLTESSTKIVYQDDMNTTNGSKLLFGTFNLDGTDPTTKNEYNYHGRPLVDQTPTQYDIDIQHVADIGNVFVLVSSHDINISNLNIDGNASGLKVGGNWGDLGGTDPNEQSIQVLNHYGIQIY